jgi:hypothetical protein
MMTEPEGGPVCPSALPDGEAGTNTRPDASEAEDAGTAARRWVPWDRWLSLYDLNHEAGGRLSSGSVRPAK